MSTSKVLENHTGIVGTLHEITFNEPNSILIFQLPRKTEMLSDVYVKGTMSTLKAALPEGRIAVIMGCDVNVYELPGADSVMLKLKGLI